jgi:hypothetical protein
MIQTKTITTMEAILQEVVNHGNIIEKIFSLDPPFTTQNTVVRDVVLEYDQESLDCTVRDLKNALILFIYDMRYMENISYDIDGDKIVLSEFLATRVKVSKECDDYSEML